jgi:hypothetical protein
MIQNNPALAFERVRRHVWYNEGVGIAVTSCPRVKL